MHLSYWRTTRHVLCLYEPQCNSTKYLFIIIPICFVVPSGPADTVVPPRNLIAARFDQLTAAPKRHGSHPFAFDSDDGITIFVNDGTAVDRTAICGNRICLTAECPNRQTAVRRLQTFGARRSEPSIAQPDGIHLLVHNYLPLGISFHAFFVMGSSPFVTQNAAR